MFVRTPVELRAGVDVLAERENWSVAYAHAYALALGLCVLGLAEAPIPLAS